MFKFETKRLIIRDMSQKDKSAFVAMSQDAKYQRFYDESDCDPSKYRELTDLFIVQASENPRKSKKIQENPRKSKKIISISC
ncbi:hypothetical protein [Vibrio parahaemolyticus]|uniref:hypothetical protein n=1 Tax=Vibrio parahaemolyticus TaxID=670 RepID=UPI00387B65A2